ncbi:gtf2h3 [Ecytonucleospora hepatopenaei]|uniref:Gtf2h3 n=1 Tax=Ecytonucleospora hepatopenaei TaxID=646526 RepID=A0A1W0E477_9MICR|nr:gtf2h3 [Ecytonucleospora hepatopenaei]
MKICILFDYDQNANENTKMIFINSIYAYINAFLELNTHNTFILVNNKQIFFDSSKNTTYKDVLKINTVPITAGDIGYALLLEPSYILVCSMFGDSLKYIDLIKCISAAIELNIKIDVFCTKPSTYWKLLAKGTSGIFIENDFVSLIKSLGGKTLKNTLEVNAKCFCCNKDVKLGQCCPICLAIFCKFTPICKCCKTKFNFT